MRPLRELILAIFTGWVQAGGLNGHNMCQDRDSTSEVDLYCLAFSLIFFLSHFKHFH